MEILRPVILLLENDESDVFLFRRALGRLPFNGTVRIVSTVTEARAYLLHTGLFTDSEYYHRPDLIVCDVKLWSGTGLQFLEWIRDQPDFASIPVVMLSGSALPEDKVKAGHLGARAFYTKTGDIEEMTEHMENMLGHIAAHREVIQGGRGGEQKSESRKQK